ncbi:sensor histidine kinase [uncultured Christiangramia sp.]|uniref:sensor histidine kinase n=1 Tax=uncultured Christiangramia sp. TaxID=503836 RepID=UPI00260346AE|nr:histidine kinase [uncultured Christiangramia sp.]
MKLSSIILGMGRKFLLHSLFWLVVLLYFTFFFGFEDSEFRQVMKFSSFFLPVTILTTYTFIYRIISRYLIPKKYLQFGLYSLAALVISACYITISAFYAKVLTSGYEYQGSFPITKSLIYIMISVYLVVALASAFSLLKYNYSTAAKNEELKNRILEAQLKLKEQELQYLKMQIHPHFLFNSLNTIYGLSLANHHTTSEMILQLSDLLDYILYQTKKPVVSLKDEIKHITNYIDLEKKRFQELLIVDFEIEEFIEEIQIAPMLLLPFVENCFKHGRGADGKLEISIKIKVKNDQLMFLIENSKAQLSAEHSENGIGLENIKRRLDLLYENNYQLDIETRPDHYYVRFMLKFSKNTVYA